MQARTALSVALAAPAPLSPAKKLALSVWADDGGTIVPGSGGEVVFSASQSPEWSEKLASERREHRVARSKSRQIVELQIVELLKKTSRR